MHLGARGICRIYGYARGLAPLKSHRAAVRVFGNGLNIRLLPVKKKYGSSGLCIIRLRVFRAVYANKRRLLGNAVNILLVSKEITVIINAVGAVCLLVYARSLTRAAHTLVILRAGVSVIALASAVCPAVRVGIAAELALVIGIFGIFTHARIIYHAPVSLNLRSGARARIWIAAFIGAVFAVGTAFYGPAAPTGVAGIARSTGVII